MRRIFVKKFIFAALVIPATVILLGSCSSGKGSITGNIKGLGNDTLLVFYGPLNMPADYNEMEHIDTVIVRGGKFSFDPSLQAVVEIQAYPKSLLYIRPNGVPLQMESRAINFFIMEDGEKVHISGNAFPDRLEYEITGNKFNTDMAVLRTESLPYRLIQDKMNIGIEEEYGKPKAQQDGQKINGYFAERNAAGDRLRTIRGRYVRNNPDEEISGYLFLAGIPYDSTAVYYNMISERVREGVFAARMRRYYDRFTEHQKVIANKEKMKPGNPAPAFTLKDKEGKDFSLADIKNKYVVIDFWGSWCGPCIHGMPKMKEYYRKYSRKLEIVGIACNDTQEAWLAAIREHALPWINVIESGDVTVDYAVEAFPTKYILDREHKIVASYRGEGEDFYKKLDELLGGK